METNTPFAPFDFNQEECEKKLNESKETQPTCPGVHCTEFASGKVYHASCEGRAIYSPVSTVGCYNRNTKVWEWALPVEIEEFCEKKEKEDPAWHLKPCFCCCACMANETPIGLPDAQQRQIGEIGVGDTVLAGTPASATEIGWEPLEVGFSQGTLHGIQPSMIYLVYGDGKQLIASPDQPLMLADGTLTTASRIVPRQDELMGSDGRPVQVSIASRGDYQGGVHHIATKGIWTGSVDGHLLQANGIVAGDFQLQIHFGQLQHSLKAADWAARPEIGTPEYEAAHPDLVRIEDSKAYAATADHPPIESDVFTPYTEAALPVGTKSFVTEAQAADILANGVQAPVTDQSHYVLAQEATAMLRGFFPDLTYYIDWDRSEPNVYAFEQYGERHVVVSGGLVRMKGMESTGVAMAVAHAVARFAASPSQGKKKLACTADSDLYAFSAISRRIWFGPPWLEQARSALKQIAGLFELISPENAAPNPQDVCDEPGIECRVRTFRSGIAGGELPECAGGPPPLPLKLETVSLRDSNTIWIAFNQPPVKAEAEEAARYQLSGGHQVGEVRVIPEHDFIVEIKVKRMEPGDYTLTCSGLKAEYGGALQPDPVTVPFKVPEEP